jgi:predicted component of type VI protein secretion system
VQLEEDSDLEIGEFGIATRMVQARRAQEADEAAGEMEAAPEPSPTRIFKPPIATEAVSAEEAEELGLAHQPSALLNVGGNRQQIPPDGAVVGRSRECQITIEDPNISRRHAEIRLENGAWSITDLGSTNGVEVNGERVKTARLEPGDRIVLGRTELVFEQT